MPKDPPEAEGATAALLSQEAVHLTTDGPHFPQSTLKSPLKAPALPVWGMHEMWDVLDALSNSSKLRENRKINCNNNKKGILKFGRKNAVQTPQECEYLCTKPLTDAFLKGNPFRQSEAAISLKDIKAAVARTQRITELSVKGWTFVRLYLLFFFNLQFILIPNFQLLKVIETANKISLSTDLPNQIFSPVSTVFFLSFREEKNYAE